MLASVEIKKTLTAVTSKPFRDVFSSALSVVREACLRPYAALISISGFTLAIGLGLEISKHLHFEYHDNSGVVGWVSVNQYPKFQELFYYLLALVGVPCVISVYWLGWLFFANLVARATSQPVLCVLKQNAFASLPLLLIWRDIYRLDRSWLTGLALPVGLMIVAKFGVFLHNRLRKPLLESQIVSQPRAMTETSPPSVRASGILSTCSAVLKWVVIPVFIYLLHYSGNIDGNIDLFHEGERLAPLNEMLRGGIPFRDVYAQHGLFQNAYLAWLGGKLFSPTLEGVRIMGRVMDPFGCVALYFLGLQIFRGKVLTSLILVLIASGEHLYVLARQTFGLISFSLVASYVTHQGDDGLFSGWKRIFEPMHQGTQKVNYRPLLLTTKDLRFIKHCLSRVRFYTSMCWAFGWKLIAAGMCTSLSFWYSTEIGLYTLAAISVFLLTYLTYGVWKRDIPGRRRLLPLMCYCGGVMVGFWSIGFYLLLHGALDDAIRNTYIQCVYQTSTWGTPFPSLTETLRPLADSGLIWGWRTFMLSKGFGLEGRPMGILVEWYLPPLAFIIATSYLTHRRLCGGFWRSDVCVKLFLLLLGGITFFRTTLGRCDAGHLVEGSAFFWVLCVFFADRGIGRIFDKIRMENINSKTRWLGALKCTWIVLPTLALLWYIHEAHHPTRAFQGKWKHLTQTPFVPKRAPEKLNRAGRIAFSDKQAEQIRKVVTYIQDHTADDEKIFDFSSQGAYYFFADRPSVTRYHQVVYASTPDMQREIIDALERDGTRLVIFKTNGYGDQFDLIPSEDRHPLISHYLAKNYELAININGAQILKRRGKVPF